MSSNILSTHTDIAIASDARFRMSGQNRTRYLNPIARVYKDAGSQTISNDTPTAVTFDAETLDTDTIHDNSSNTSRLTAPLTGKYFVYGVCQFEADAGNGLVGMYFYKNGALESLGNFVLNDGPSTGAICTGGVVISLSATDYVELYAYQASGGDLDVLGGDSYNTSFGMFYIGE
jgi:hypothetical protein